MLVYIQILRLLAAVAVVAFHAWGVAPEGFKVPESAISFVLSYGGHGVDLFFVISGFIIFYATHRATLTPAEFLRRRVERIVPLYFVVTFAVIILAMTLPATFGTEDGTRPATSSNRWRSSLSPTAKCRSSIWAGPSNTRCIFISPWRC